jgi:hypothetical protein
MGPLSGNLGEQRYQEVYDERLVASQRTILPIDLRYRVPGHKAGLDICPNSGVNLLPVAQKHARESIKHGQILPDSDIALAVAAGRALSRRWK